MQESNFILLTLSAVLTMKDDIIWGEIVRVTSCTIIQ